MKKTKTKKNRTYDAPEAMKRFQKSSIYLQQN